MRRALFALAFLVFGSSSVSAQDPPLAHDAPLDSPDDRLLTLVCDARGATALTSMHALRWDGRVWRAWETPEGGVWTPRSAAVLGDGTLYVTVGDLVYRLSASGWTSFAVQALAAPSGPRHGPYQTAPPRLVALTAAGPERIVGVGSNHIYLRDGDAFRPFWSGTWRSLEAVWSDGPGQLWAVGTGDAVQRWDGARWRSMQTRSGLDWRGITGSGPRDVWLWSSAADGPRLMRYDGRRFHDVSAGLPAGAIEHVASDGTETFVSVGGAVLRHDAERWVSHVMEAPGARICAAGATWIAIAQDTRMWTWPRREPAPELARPGRSREQ